MHPVRQAILAELADGKVKTTEELRRAACEMPPVVYQHLRGMLKEGLILRSKLTKAHQGYKWKVAPDRSRATASTSRTATKT